VNIPTRAFVESHGGTYFGHFCWPIKEEESVEFFAFRVPPNQLRHDHIIRNRVVVYSLPNLFKHRGAKDVENHINYEGAA